MQFTSASNPAEPAITTLEALTPLFPFAGVVVGGLIVGAFQVWNRKRGAIETRAPDVTEIWVRQAADQAELDMERRFRRRVEDLFIQLRSAFQSYVMRVQGGGSTELTTKEAEMFYVQIPTPQDPSATTPR